MTTPYPLDETGVAESNVITNETQSLQVYNSGGYLFVVPAYAPFFETDVVISYSNGTSSRLLQMGVDYVFGGKYFSASVALKKGVYSTICIINSDIANNIKLDRYHTLGGLETISTAKRIEVLQDILINPAVVYWEQLVDLSTVYQSSQHYELFEDVVGQAELVSAIADIADNVGNNASQITQTDLDNLRNYVLTLKRKPDTVVNTQGAAGTMYVGSVADHCKTYVATNVSVIRLNPEVAYTGSSDWYTSEASVGYSPKPMPVGGEVSIVNLNQEDAAMTIVAAIGVSMHTSASFVVKRRGAVKLKKIALNQWVVSGDLEPGSGQTISN